MYRIESIELGEYRGDDYFLVGFVESEPQEGEDYDPDEDARNYGVALVQKGVGVLGENTQIARMDTRHGQAHLDKEFVPPDADEQDTVWLDEGYPYERMWSSFLQPGRRSPTITSSTTSRPSASGSSGNPRSSVLRESRPKDRRSFVTERDLRSREVDGSEAPV